MSDINALFDRFRSTTPKLNKIADEAKAIVQQVETFLRDECQLGIPAEIVADTTEPERGVDQDNHLYTWSQLCLAYGRHGNGHRLLVIHKDVEGSKDEWNDWQVDCMTSSTATPWLEASRDDRLATFAVLPQLLETLATTAERTVGKAEAAAKTIADLTAAKK